MQKFARETTFTFSGTESTHLFTIFITELCEKTPTATIEYISQSCRELSKTVDQKHFIVLRQQYI
jgi:hypothetical protein